MYMSEIMLRILCLFALVNIVRSFGERKGIKIDRFEACDYSANSPYKWDEVIYENLPNGAVRVASRGAVLREVPKLIITLDISRCSSKESLDSCQPFAKLNPLDTCKLVTMKGMAFTSVVEAFTPAIRCPAQKGIYTSKNSTLDPNFSFYVPLDNWYWKIACKVMDRGEHMTVCLDFQSYTIRRQ